MSKVTSILQTLDVESGHHAELARFDYLIEAPNWLKDGSHLVYNSGGQIYIFDMDTLESHLVDTGFVNRSNNDHVLSPDHTLIGVSHHTKEDHQSRVYVVPLKGGVPQLITPLAPSYLHGWSPDGKTLAYCAERNGNYDIYTIPAVGGEEVRLTDAPGLDDGPEFSPDGRHIWFNSVRTGLMQVWRMNADGSEQTQMTFDESNNWFPHVSPDGKWVVFISYRKGDVDPSAHPANKNVELRLMSSSGGEVRTLVSLFGGQGTQNVNSWSPDSRSIAFVSYVVEE